ncbi:hypothetical protein CMK12_03960 [Candidatus Poribacteria bacterium]|jgi:xanthine dehydrogenase YagR molybdenum-binding subunit|nr:hypothetical protein [Candidatus Poribacteria bacterium]MDP6595453.1 xanthine dehydrogenase family protein molybdopterin-binding subunit [Candidatus Poribacteria bacterium]MDP6746404.1 xanthine dehydrogenase family protein molybdopterin-binding subunit [Candidatus Poribacteria bacterium]MDP6995225.1 xanthine dehydrogenase family protein molybdopterin-binding subunit [Candidatus Poribacteria bacterium]
MAEWGEARKSSLLGKYTQRLSGPQKVTGQAKYTFDINRPGMLYGRILRSHIPRGTLTALDLSPAQQMPGVKAAIPLIEVGKEIRYEGQEIAAVAADTKDIAADAIRAIRFDYDPLDHVVDLGESMSESSPQIRDWENNQSDRQIDEKGDLQAGWTTADAVVEATYSTEVQVHTCLESHGHVAEWDGDQLTVWASTQAVFGTRRDFARHFELPEDKVRVITEHMGGGFGSKFGPGVEGQAAAKLAKETGQPVKLMLTRKGEQNTAGNRPSMVQHVKAGATKEGKLVAYEVSGYGTSGLGGGAGFTGPYVYQVPNYRTEKFNVAINAGSGRAFRAPRHPQGAFAMDSLMDELAEKIGMDSLEFRKLNDPNEIRHAEYDRGAEEIGWNRRQKVAGSAPGIQKRGIGVGSGQWGGGGGKGTKARVNINSDGTVEAVTGTQDLGTGIRTAIAIIVADELGLQPTDITVKIGDTLPGLPSGGSGGSQTTPSVAPVVKTAAMAAKESLINHLAEKVNVVADEVVIKEGSVTIGNNQLSWKEAASTLGMETISEEGSWDENLREGGAAGAQFAEVEVDTETGQVKLIKIVAVQDCGLIINRLATESQINGGVIGGIGYALLEDRIMDGQTGRSLNSNLIDYKVAGAQEIPEIRAIAHDTDRKVTGIGEPVTIPTAGAIANAVYNAIGVRVRSLPITPDKVLTALEEA